MPKLSATRLNDRIVDRATPQDKPYEIRDAGQSGLVLRVQPSGRKSWVVQVNRATRRTIADASRVKVEAARIQASEFLLTFDPDKERGPSPKLKDYLDGQFLEWMVNRSKYGKRDTARLVSALGALGNIKLDALTHARVDRWFIDRDVAPATKNRELAQLKSALNRAVEWDMLDTNPAQKVKAVKDDAGKRVRYLDDDERKRLMKALDERNGDYLSTMTHLALSTGLRRGEVFQLDWEDINFKDARVHVCASKAKSKRDRYIPLNATITPILKAWRLKSGNRTGLVFRGPKGRFRDIKRQWSKLVKVADVQDFHFHDCRHDFASRLVQLNVSLYQVRDLLGHSTIQLTERYSHLRQENLQDAVKALE
jgi:integrase